MNEQDRAELQSLKEQQSELLRQVSVLAEGLRGKEALLDTARRDLQQLRAAQSSLDEARRGLESAANRTPDAPARASLAPAGGVCERIEPARLYPAAPRPAACSSR